MTMRRLNSLDIFGAGEVIVEYPISQDCCIYIIDADKNYHYAMFHLFGRKGYEVLAYDSGQTFLDNFDDLSPGVIVLNLKTQGMEGIELLKKINQYKYPLPAIILTNHSSHEKAIEVLNESAFKYIALPKTTDEVIELVTAAIPRAMEQAQNALKTIDADKLLNTLTPTEFKIFECLAEGLNSQAIASEHRRNFETVRKHRVNINRKLKTSGVENYIRIAGGAKNLFTPRN